MNDAKVFLWGTEIGAISWLDDRQVGVFQYSPAFLPSGIQVAPLQMPLREFPFDFPDLPKNTFRGLPGLVADSLPDKFGNAVIDAWLASTSRDRASFNPVERLCYVGNRGMGALEYHPAVRKGMTTSEEIDIAELVELSNLILQQRAGLSGKFTGVDDKNALGDILRVSTSAGGARAKAVIAWNPSTNEFRSGQVDAPPGYEHWILKFDGITGSSDKGISQPAGYGKIEYVYHLMALQAGIRMSPCRLHHEGGRSHFMTQRFDRNVQGGKLHMQSLCAMAHFDYNQPSLYSYEEAIQIMKKLGLSNDELDQQVLRAIFNVVGRNQDDHVKNIAFLMDRQGQWSLSPAFDMTYSYDPFGEWTNYHQMSINGKRANIVQDDLLALASLAGIKKRRALGLIDQVVSAFKSWQELAIKQNIPDSQIAQIQSQLQLDLL